MEVSSHLTVAQSCKGNSYRKKGDLQSKKGLSWFFLLSLILQVCVEAVYPVHCESMKQHVH